MPAAFKWIIAALILAAAAATTGRAAEWETDFTKASQAAKKSGKYMLLDFSGSDWCGWCVRLEDEVFSKPVFQSYARENLICVLLDFPRRKPQPQALKEQNEELAKKFGIRGFPTVLVLSPDGDLVGKTGYQRGGPQAYVSHLKAMIAEYAPKRLPSD